MGITLFNLMNNTPDRVRSLDNGSDDQTREFTWFLRDKDKPGLNIKLRSRSEDKENPWEVLIYKVSWKENEFVEEDDPMHKYMHKNSDEAISCAETKIKSICDKNEQFEHCINFLRA
jgi:hypothetical protein